jgi:hypothetical protein
MIMGDVLKGTQKEAIMPYSASASQAMRKNMKILSPKFEPGNSRESVVSK